MENGWIHGWVGGWGGEWMEGWREGGIHGWIDGQIHRWMGVDGSKLPSSLTEGISAQVCSAGAPRERPPSEPLLEGG